MVGIGNALVNVISHAGDDFIDLYDLVKGSMTLIDTEPAVLLYKALGTTVEMSGGSAANTVCGVASLGGRAAYIGKVSADDLGDVFGHDLRAVGVQFRPGEPDGETPTGRCIIVVTPDAQRTMNTYLGVSSLLCPTDIDDQTVAAGAVLYMEGYLYDRAEAKEAFRRAARVAHQHGRLVSLTLSDSFCVDRHRTDFRALVTDEVDILFGNESELLSLYEVETLADAIHRVREDCHLAVITIGADGCMIVSRDEVIQVDAEPVERVLDTTGAGDLFAAGFLYGYTRQLSYTDCACASVRSLPPRSSPTSAPGRSWSCAPCCPSGSELRAPAVTVRHHRTSSLSPEERPCLITARSPSAGWARSPTRTCVPSCARCWRDPPPTSRSGSPGGCSSVLPACARRSVQGPSG
ncbi:MAG: PfkB family carbohydrate kinase [Albidovulum sp.]